MSGSRQALVLSGGGIKGAYQAGAIAEVLKPEYGFRPTAVYGISVGSINGGMLASYVGQQVRKKEAPDLAAAADRLESYWRTKITDFTKLGTKRFVLFILWEVLFGNFKGMVRVDNAIRIIREEIKTEDLVLAASKEGGDLAFFAGTLDLTAGEYLDAPWNDPLIIEYVIASGMQPIVMPMRVIPPRKPNETLPEKTRRLFADLTEYLKTMKPGHRDTDDHWLDGGLHNVAPLGKAIDDQYDDIVCIACRPDKIGRGSFQGSLPALGERLSDVVAQRLLDNDIAQALKINEWVDRIQKEAIQSDVERDFLSKFKRVDIHLIRPAEELDFDLRTFKTGNIGDMIAKGHADARAEMKASPRVRTPSSKVGARSAADQAGTR